MSRIVLGIDERQHWTASLNFLERLQFADAHLSLIHADLNCPDESISVSKLRAAQLLEEGQRLAEEKGFVCSGRFTHGPVESVLISASQPDAADILAVNAHRHGVARSSYVGSTVTAAILASKTSVLVSKGEQGRRGFFRAILATDHSVNSELWLNQLLELRPAGIEEFIVVHACGDEAGIAEAGERNNRVCDRLREAGYAAKSWLRTGSATEVLHHAMRDAAADLLILGAKGQSDFAPSPIGSVALHQVVGEFYPVLVMRPSPESV